MGSTWLFLSNAPITKPGYGTTEVKKATNCQSLKTAVLLVFFPPLHLDSIVSIPLDTMSAAMISIGGLRVSFDNGTAATLYAYQNLTLFAAGQMSVHPSVQFFFNIFCNHGPPLQGMLTIWILLILAIHPYQSSLSLLYNSASSHADSMDQ